jgi:hypothetical protein
MTFVQQWGRMFQKTAWRWQSCTAETRSYFKFAIFNSRFDGLYHYCVLHRHNGDVIPYDHESISNRNLYREDLNKGATSAYTGAKILIFRTWKHKIEKKIFTASEILPTIFPTPTPRNSVSIEVQGAGRSLNRYTTTDWVIIGKSILWN